MMLFRPTTAAKFKHFFRAFRTKQVCLYQMTLFWHLWIKIPDQLSYCFISLLRGNYPATLRRN